jgi:dTDP-4-amino-4,6-dideoxy-D-glucose transaminase
MTDQEFIQQFRLPEPVHVTRPAMPALKDYVEYLSGIWDRKWLTNAGPLHEALERELCSFLGVPHLSLFCNGTIALLVALEVLDIDDGEVITTPFTFPATTHALHWNRIRPVFCDIDPETLNLDPRRIEPLISAETRAILPVHVYGRPCAVEAIQKIAEKHGLRVIYDAAHAFGVKYNGKPLVSYGDLSVLSFHATKLFSTVEGGALISGSDLQRKRVNFLKNFGIADEETVVGPGINGKMNEFQAAFGLMQLKMVDHEIQNRGAIAALYRDGLKGISGITMLQEAQDTEPNNGYFPILIDAERYGMTRDELFAALRQCNILARKYFYPLISHASCYASLPSAAPSHLMVAERVSRQVLCLPIYGDLELEIVRHICRVIAACHHAASRHDGGAPIYRQARV